MASGRLARQAVSDSSLHDFLLMHWLLQIVAVEIRAQQAAHSPRRDLAPDVLLAYQSCFETRSNERAAGITFPLC